MVLRRWTFFVCDFAIQNLYVDSTYKFRLCQTDLSAVSPGGAILQDLYTVESVAGELFAALVGAVVRTCDLAPARS